MDLIFVTNEPTCVACGYLVSEHIVHVGNTFCPTGKGGGIDPTCGKSKGGGGGISSELKAKLEPHLTDKGSISIENNGKSKNAKKIEPEIKAGLNKIPTNMRVAGGSSSKVEIIDKPPKGVPSNVDAYFQSGGISAGGYIKVIAKKDQESLDVTAVHEYGHAVDRWLGNKSGLEKNLSDHEEFQNAFNSDIVNLSDRGKLYHGYAASSSREAFAESFAEVAGIGRFKGEDRAVQVSEAFPNSTAWVRSIFE